MDNIVLIGYFVSLSILFIFGLHGFVLLFYHRKYKDVKINSTKDFENAPLVTIQLPLYNELYVIERLIDKVCEIEYPKEKLEIQVLDDSTDETVDVVAKAVDAKKKEGFNIEHVRRSNREGFKAGALKEGLKIANGEFVAIFDADFIPHLDFLKKTLKFFTDEKVGMVQTRWEHLNGDHSLITRAQALALDRKSVV